MTARLMVGAALAACSIVIDPSPSSVRVLFIGNSFTTVNDVPAMVSELARASGRPFDYQVVAFGGYSLQDHWIRGDAQRAIMAGPWSFVVMQEGPSALPASRVELREYVRRFAEEVRRVGARPALFMVWPAAARRNDFNDVRASYATAAADVGGLFLPAGAAWLEAWQRDPGLKLYGPDGLHATRLGSYLAALVLFGSLFDQSPAGLPTLGLPAEQVRIVQEAAAVTIRRPRRGSLASRGCPSARRSHPLRVGVSRAVPGETEWPSPLRR